MRGSRQHQSVRTPGACVCARACVWSLGVCGRPGRSWLDPGGHSEAQPAPGQSWHVLEEGWQGWGDREQEPTLSGGTLPTPAPSETEQRLPVRRTSKKLLPSSGRRGRTRRRGPRRRGPRGRGLRGRGLGCSGSGTVTSRRRPSRRVWHAVPSVGDVITRLFTEQAATFLRSHKLELSRTVAVSAFGVYVQCGECPGARWASVRRAGGPVHPGHIHFLFCGTSPKERHCTTRLSRPSCSCRPGSGTPGRSGRSP